MTPFHVGMKVVCVRAEWDHEARHSSDPVVGGVCQIQNLEADNDMSSGVGLWFLDADPDGFYDSGYFRPAHENRMDELRTLLAPVPSKELVQS